MKLVYKDVEHIITFEKGYVSELIVENRNLFLRMVTDFALQTDGSGGNAVMSINNKPVEMSRYADVVMQFAPFELNKKSLITKLINALERKAVDAENFLLSNELLNNLEAFVLKVSEDLDLDVECTKLSVGNVLKALGIEIVETDKHTLEKILDYMELVRTFDRDRLFIMVNMRTYFSNDEMDLFIRSACSHDFNVLLLESVSFPTLPNTKRYVIDEDLCEF